VSQVSSRGAGDLCPIPAADAFGDPQELELKCDGVSPGGFLPTMRSQVRKSEFLVQTSRLV
jgi:hypothetical protein